MICSRDTPFWLETLDMNLVSFCFRTLYCAKGNYEFGISRVIKSLEPYNKKLGTDTWFYAKRCFLSLIENMAKHMIMIRDSVIAECIQFLECCECKINKLFWISAVKLVQFIPVTVYKCGLKVFEFVDILNRCDADEIIDLK